MNVLWENFKDWLSKSWMEHPIYTSMFGVICIFIGGIIF